MFTNHHYLGLAENKLINTIPETVTPVCNHLATMQYTLATM